MGSRESPRACANCTHAKTKCSIVASAESICERCHRLGKDCRPAPYVEKQRKVTKRRQNKVDRLEKKIDGIFDILKMTRSENHAATTSPCSGIDTACHEGSSSLSNEKGSNPEKGLNPTPAMQLPLFQKDSDLELSLESAEAYLENFRTNFLHHLPFLTISPAETASQIRKERPILWLSIMAVASKKSDEQVVLSRTLREIFGTEAYIRGTRTLDFLQGVLVSATWDRRLSLEKPILISLVQLAIAILYDLDLDRTRPSDSGFVLMKSIKGETVHQSKSSQSPTLEERRASIGCYLLSTLLSSTRSGQSLRWTAYLDDCLHVLEDTKEFESDQFLVIITRFRIVSDKTADTSCSRFMRGQSSTVPAIFYVRSLEAELRQCTVATPKELLDNKIVLLERFYTEFKIYEIGLIESNAALSGERSNLGLECLYSWLQATKSWITTLLSIDTRHYPGLTSLVMGAMTSCLTCLCRFASREIASWNLEDLNLSINVSLFLQELADKYARVRETVGIDADVLGGSDYFTIKASRLRSMQAAWDALITPTVSTQELELFSLDFLNACNW